MATINVMAPLLVGNPNRPDDEASKDAWQRFDADLAAAKALGATAVSTDIWWGLVEKAERKYDWRFYDKLSNHIIAAKLKWVPIISLHNCFGNVGDQGNKVLLARWVWQKLAKLTPSGNALEVKYVTEQGNVSNEYVSCWATDLILPDYLAFFQEFQQHFAQKAPHITEINISLGPAGELRYPSYNSHDEDSDYPTRGALQCYSPLARRSFREWVLRKYGSFQAVRAAWGQLRRIEPPRDCEAFFRDKVHLKTQYGKDFFDWYQESLLSHGRKLMTAAINTFSADGAAFKGIDIGAKVPGIHWHMGYRNGDKRIIGDRLAELAAGLIRTSSVRDWYRDDKGRGYREIVTLFRELGQVKPQTRVVMHFTCLEMADPVDRQSNAGVNSLAQSLVTWVGKEALSQGVPIKGENALAGGVYSPACWERMRSALALQGNNGAYEGLTILRMSDVVGSPLASDEFRVTASSLSRPTVVAIAQQKDDCAA